MSDLVLSCSGAAIEAKERHLGLVLGGGRFCISFVCLSGTRSWSRLLFACVLDPRSVLQSTLDFGVWLLKEKGRKRCGTSRSCNHGRRGWIWLSCEERADLQAVSVFFFFFLCVCLPSELEFCRAWSGGAVLDFHRESTTELQLFS